MSFGRPPQVFLSVWAFLLIGLLPVRAQCDEAPTGDLGVTDVIFFKSGVSYIRHSGHVTGSRTMTLHFQAGQMKDVLKSMVLQDRRNGPRAPA